MTYGWFISALVLHVLAVVVWIGGIAAVATVMFPAMRGADSVERKISLFHQVERRFRPQARIAWLLVGLSGFYMVYVLDAWTRFAEVRYWWMQAMVALWVIFGLMLFAVEPLVAGPRLERKLATDPAAAIARMEALHWVLLVLSLLVIAVAVAGTNGAL
ncbi:MAG: hypothetical protein ACREQN_04610 [Candidatus Binataceae bacterium]